MATTRSARLYLWVWGTALVILGTGSLIVHPDFAVGDGVTEKHVFGVFETNGWHGLSGLAFGVFALAYARSARWAPTVAAVVAVGGGIIPAATFALVGDDGVALGLIPVDLADAVTLHLLPGLVGVVCAALEARSGHMYAMTSAR